MALSQRIQRYHPEKWIKIDAFLFIFIRVLPYHPWLAPKFEPRVFGPPRQRTTSGLKTCSIRHASKRLSISDPYVLSNPLPRTKPQPLQPSAPPRHPAHMEALAAAHPNTTLIRRLEPMLGHDTALQLVASNHELLRNIGR
jgi:hypothetical protein